MVGVSKERKTENIRFILYLTEHREAKPNTAGQQSPTLDRLDASESSPQHAPEPDVVPLKRLRLQELVKLFAEVLRESDLVEDIEMGVRDGSSEVRNDPSGDSRGDFADSEDHIAQIWRKVPSMVMETVNVDPDAQQAFHECWRSVDDLYKLFIPKFWLEDDTTKYKKNHLGSELHACLLRWRLNELQNTRHEEVLEA